MSDRQLGPYRLVRKLARGGMAEIFLAVRETDDGFARELVIKRILPNLASSPEFRRMFRAEARLAARLSHPHIVHVYDYGAITDHGEETFYLAMELLRGVDLRALVIRAAEDAARESRPYALAPHHAAKIAAYVCEALSYAHGLVVEGQPAAIVHRDVTPSNVLLSFEGAVKLADFGVAKASAEDVGTRVGVVKGKRRYLSPEQARGEPLDARSDLFNVGILLFESILGEPLFPSSGTWRPGEVPDRFRVRRMPTALADVTERALSARAGDRYPDALAMRADLEGYIRKAGEPTGSVEIGTLVRTLFPETLAEDQRSIRAAGTIAQADVPRAAATALIALKAEREAGTQVADDDSSANRLIASETIALDLAGLSSRTAATQVKSAIPETRVHRQDAVDGATVVDRPAPRRMWIPIVIALVIALIFLLTRSSDARTAQITIHSEPAGASVTLDGSEIGRAPLEVHVEPRAHHVEVSLPGYAPQATDVGFARADEEVELSFTLTP